MLIRKEKEVSIHSGLFTYHVEFEKKDNKVCDRCGEAFKIGGFIFLPFTYKMISLNNVEWTPTKDMLCLKCQDKLKYSGLYAVIDYIPKEIEGGVDNER